MRDEYDAILPLTMKELESNFKVYKGLVAPGQK